MYQLCWTPLEGWHLCFFTACPRSALLGSRLAVHVHRRRLVLLADRLDASGQGLGLGVILHLFFLLLVIAALVLCNTGEQVVGQDAQDQEEPKEIDGLETSQQTKGDVLTDPALVLLRLPVQLEGPDSAELGEDGPEDLQVQHMSEVNPDSDERGEIGSRDDRVEVIESFRRLNATLAGTDLLIAAHPIPTYR